MRVFTVLMLVLSIAGCTQVVVRKNPKPRDLGIRYYRPKPYLFISPAAASGPKASTQTITLPKPLEIKTSDSSAVDRPDFQLASFDPAPGAAIQGGAVPPATNQAPGGGITPALGADLTADDSKASDRPTAISMEIKYLPDFAEEYSIRLMPGLGVGEMNVQLQDGWNLTSLGVKTDQQTDEIINSVANVIDKSGGAFGSRDASMSGIYATNIPFGFYEAVIAEDPCGRKQLYGWRYIGFMPFQTCPTQPCGIQGIDCNGPEQTIYGLVWVDGILQFTALTSIPTTPVIRSRSSVQDQSSPTPPSPTPVNSALLVPMPPGGTAKRSPTAVFGLLRSWTH